MNSKLRCTFCRDYYESDSVDSIKVGLSGVCSSECLSGLQDKARAKRARRIVHRENKVRYGRRLPGGIREVVRDRDKRRCRYCGVGTSARLEIHHIQYRSQGGCDQVWNLILLCDEHHRLMHSSKKTWQKVLQLVQWAYYTEGVLWTIPKAEKALKVALS